MRSLKTLEARPLEGTEGATGFPFWSPDSRYIAYVAQGKLMKIEASGGPPVTLCNAVPGYGGAWNRDDKIVFGSPAGLLQVAASGGSPTPITTDVPSGVPFFLPDQHHFVYWRAGDQGGGSGIYVGLTGTKPQEQVSKKLLSDNSMPVFTPSSNPDVGYLLFIRATTSAGTVGTLMSQPIDTRRLELTGEAVPIAEEIPMPSFSASATDVLVYFRGSPTVVPGGASGNVQGQLAWFDREGKVLGTVGDPGIYRSLALSPDGKRVAFERAYLLSPFTRNIWLYDFARGVTTRFTFGSAWDSNPVWSPDGSLIAFTSDKSGTFNLYQKASNLAGEDELMFKSGEANLPSSWSPDGRFLLYYSFPSPRLWLLPLGGEAADRKAVLLEHSEFNQAWGRFSPDGRWFAYNSDESGRYEIYVRSFDASSTMGSRSEGGTPITGKWMVSKDGGTTPLWRRDGKEQFYLSLDGTAMAVEVSTSGVFQAGIPKALFKVPRGELFWDVASDGKRFLMAAPSTASSNAQPSFTVVLNWQSGLKK